MANIPTQNNNPGDLKDPKTGQFRVFSTPEEGFSALQEDLLGKMTGATTTSLTPDSTLSDFANVWAPSSDNNDPTSYAQKLAVKLGVPVNTPIGSLKSRVGDFASAIADNEGYQGNRVLGDTVSAQPAQPEAPASQSKQPEAPASQSKQLTRSQLIANINAMAQQGASPQVIQGYLDSLKSSSNQGSQGGQFPLPDASELASSLTASPAQANSQNPGIIGNISKGNYLGAASDAIQGLGNALTGGGAGELGNAIGTNTAYLENKLSGLFGGKDNSQYITPADPGQAIKGGLLSMIGAGALGLGEEGVSGLQDAANPLNDPAIAYNIPMEMSDFFKLGNTEKLNVLGNALKDPDIEAGDASAIAKAMKYLDPGDSSGIVSRLIKGGASAAKQAILISVFGGSIGGLIHSVTGK